jgi:DNA-binding response OmpR family regulator
MKRRILLVDDEVAVLLTLKAVLEISGFDVDTATSAREGRHKLRNREYHMVITDMRMESDEAGREVISAARTAPYHPAVALLTAFPLADEDWQDLGADKMLVKPMHTKVLLQQIEKLLAGHESKLKIWSSPAPAKAAGNGALPSNGVASSKATAKRATAKPVVETRPAAAGKSSVKKAAGKAAGARKSA